jgi:hypothetical protein
MPTSWLLKGLGCGCASFTTRTSQQLRGHARGASCRQARSNVGKRLEFIRRELDRLEGQSTSLMEKLGRKQQQVWHVAPAFTYYCVRQYICVSMCSGAAPDSDVQRLAAVADREAAAGDPGGKGCEGSRLEGNYQVGRRHVSSGPQQADAACSYCQCTWAQLLPALVHR